MHIPLGHGELTDVDGPIVMGILNVTPDSFSDGGLYDDPASACAQAHRMIREGAGILDIGGESTRPGSKPVPPDEQIRRVVPVIRRLRDDGCDVPISVDTRLAQVARPALEAGADVINDISALRDDPDLADVLRQTGAAVVLMHRRGTPSTMQRGGGPVYRDVVSEVLTFLAERAAFAQGQGIDPARIILDPGIGFGKRAEDNLRLIRHLGQLVETGYPVLLGASRKRFVRGVLDIEEPAQRLYGSLACAAWAARAGVAIIRAHDVSPTVQTLRMIRSIGQA